VLDNTAAKSKKTILILFITLGVFGGISVFSSNSYMAVVGILISVGVIAALAFGSYYLLKQFDDLPELLQ